MKEVWRPVRDYEGYYEVSNLGRVKGVKRTITEVTGKVRVQKERILKLHKNSRGYKWVYLCRCGKPKAFRIHRLVARHFVPRIAGKPNVNHKDGNQGNNRADNLEWCTQKENIQHAFRVGLAKRGGAHHSAKLSDKDVFEIRLLRDKGAPAKWLAKIFGVHESTIYSLAKGAYRA